MRTGKDHLALRVAYDGAAFSGFQIQKGKKTVQGELERILKTIFHRPVRIEFTSRTDSGVHGFDNWVIVPEAFDEYQSLSERLRANFRRSIVSLSRERISVWQVIKLSHRFRADRDVLWKEYHYRVLNGRGFDPHERLHSWWIRSPLHIEKMRQAICEFEGERDFSAMTRPQALKLRRTPVRNMLKAALRVNRHPTFSNVHLLTFQFRATGFLHHMVRNMVGTLVEIGSGQLDAPLSQILESRDRREAGVRAPASGLFLVKTCVRKSIWEDVSQAFDHS